jgi:uncharacterized protein (DUF433 family)
MGGTPFFRGTRVPIQSLIDFLEGGETVDAFLNLYPPIRASRFLLCSTSPTAGSLNAFLH